MAVSYLPEHMDSAVKEFEKKYAIKVILSLEDQPMGTAGPLSLAAKYLSSCDYFFVLNSDVVCEFPFAELIQFHSKHGREGTILTTRVKEPSRYGVVVSKDDGQIERFVEKPQEWVGDKINAGMYIFTPAILKRIPVGEPTSIEKVVFPAMARDQQLYQMDLHGFWMDVGMPKGE